MVTLEKIKLTDIIPAEYNPRTINNREYEKLTKNIAKYGIVDPIIINLKNNHIIGGHQRYKVLTAAGTDKDYHLIKHGDIGWVFPDEQPKVDTLQDEKTLNLGLNKIQGEWDYQKLEPILLELDNMDFDLDLTGFEEITLTEIESINNKEIPSDAIEPIYQDNGTPQDDTESIDSTEYTEKTYNTMEKPCKEDRFPFFTEDEILEDGIAQFITYDTLESFIKDVIDVPSAKYQFNKLCNGYKSGYNISLLFNPHRLLVTTEIDSQSVYQRYNTDAKYQQRLMKFIMCQNKLPTQCEYKKFINVGIHGNQVALEFHPYTARNIYKQHVEDGDKILDPCAGWGGRMIGFASLLHKNTSYTCYDVSTKTVEGLQKLSTFLKQENTQIHKAPFENANLPEDYYDFIFTSPPYYNTEHYSDDQEQSYIQYHSYQLWKTEFLYKLIDNTLHTLKPGKKCILNVGKNKYNIPQDIQEYLQTEYNITTGAYQDPKAFSARHYDNVPSGEVFLEYKKPE